MTHARARAFAHAPAHTPTHTQAHARICTHPRARSLLTPLLLFAGALCGARGEFCRAEDGSDSAREGRAPARSTPFSPSRPNLIPSSPRPLSPFSPHSRPSAHPLTPPPTALSPHSPPFTRPAALYDQAAAGSVIPALEGALAAAGVASPRTDTPPPMRTTLRPPCTHRRDPPPLPSPSRPGGFWLRHPCPGGCARGGDGGGRGDDSAGARRAEAGGAQGGGKHSQGGGGEAGGNEGAHPPTTL